MFFFVLFFKKLEKASFFLPVLQNLFYRSNRYYDDKRIVSEVLPHSVKLLARMPLGGTTLTIMTLSIKGWYVTLTLSDSQQNGTQHSNSLPLCWVSCFIYYKLNVVMLNVIMLSVTFYLLVCRLSLCWVSWRLPLGLLTNVRQGWKCLTLKTNALATNVLAYSIIISFVEQILDNQILLWDNLKWKNNFITIWWDLGQCYKTFYVRTLRIFVIS